MVEHDHDWVASETGELFCSCGLSIKEASFKERIEQGDYTRAGGNAICILCGKEFIHHKDVYPNSWLTLLCDNRIVKL